MNKSKIITPLAIALLTLTSCGGDIKTKKVKTIWGNAWKYTNTVSVAFTLEDHQYIEDNKNDIDWAKTEIITSVGSCKYLEGDQTIDKIFSADFIRTCDAKNYPAIAKQRDFFSKNKIVVSKKEDKTITIGGIKYTDAMETNGVERISFNNDKSYLLSSCDNDGIIEQLTICHQVDNHIYCNKIKINVYFNLKNDYGDGGKICVGEGYFEIAALA